MKTTIITMISALASICWVQAFDLEKASTTRFKVSYVESEKLPPLTVIPKQFSGREGALKYEAEATESGKDRQVIDEMRRIYLRDLYFPIRVTDNETGNTYEVQADRRTIVARTKEGKVIWRVNPFEDAKLKPYRVQYPFIVYFGRSTMAIQDGKGDRFLGVAFNSSQFGVVNLADGSFTFEGQD